MSTLNDEITLKLADAGELIKSVYRFNFDLATRILAGKIPSNKWSETVVPYLRSPPGIGKTSIVWAATTSLSREFSEAGKGPVNFRGFIGAQYDPAEMAGFIFLDQRDTNNLATIRAKPDFMPTTDNYILLCDEFSQMSMMQKNIMAQLIQERRLGEHRLSPFATMTLAGNRLQDSAGAQADPSHVSDRVTIINVVADKEDWFTWAMSNCIRSEVVSFLRFSGKHFHDFDGKAVKSATPRGWSKVSTILDMTLPEAVESAAIAGTVGSGAATAFVAHLRIARGLPDPDKMLLDPQNCKIPLPEDKPHGPSVVYALIGALADRANNENFDAVVTIAERYSKNYGEYAVLLLRDCILRNAGLQKNKAFHKWVATTGRETIVR